MLPLVPGFGREINGARIWAYLGPISFQPGEFAKVVLAIFFAAYLVEKRELLGMATFPRFAPVLPDLKHLGPLLLAWAASIVVMTAEKDLGSSLLFFALFILLVWIATERVAYLGVGVGLFGLGSLFAYKAFAHVHDRVQIWLNPWKDFNGKGFQVVQSWFAMAWGGVPGTGLGLGNPDRVPVGTTDFIFAAIAEETGLLGASAVIACFVLLVGCGLRIAVRAERAVREAARRRAHDPARRAVVHHHGRGHAAAPPHRRHAAVRVLRRLVAGRELRAARAADAHLR